MKLKTKIGKFQEGGPMPISGDPVATDPGAQMAPDAGAPAGAPQDDPLLQLLQMAQQAVETGDGQLALGVCEGFIQIVQQMAGEGAPPEAAPAGEPVFGSGGKILRRV